jgi:acyl CoA:acetate/3-ketoacid CoA transferase alpha subunit
MGRVSDGKGTFVTNERHLVSRRREGRVDKVVTSAPAAKADVRDGSMPAVGRFGLCEFAPEVTVDEVRAKSGADLHVRDHPSDLLGAGPSRSTAGPYDVTARIFNPACAMAGKVAIAGVEHLVEPGELDPDAIHLPGVYIDRIVPLTSEQGADKGSSG